MSKTLATRDLALRINHRHVLNAVNVTVRPGELLGIVGANGAGKSSLLKTMLGITQPSAGEVLLDGVPLHALPARARARHVAYLAQGHGTHWPLAVHEVVALGRLPHVRDARHDAEQVEQALHETDTWALRNRNVQHLSGGERARVLLARALAVQAPVLLADEPLAALDPAHQLRIMQLLHARAEQGQAVAVVLHDLVLATRFCTQLLMLHDGQVLAQGNPDDVCTDSNLARGFGVGARRLHDGTRVVTMPWQLATDQDITT